jgi:membrane protein implicated in regulation of membrane protease activity
VTFRLPAVPPGLFGNLLGLLALAAFAVCVGGFLTALAVPGAWWVAGIVGAVEAFALSWVAAASAEAEPAQDQRHLSVAKAATAKTA